MLDKIARLRESVSKVYLGDPQAIDRIIRCLLARGHVLIEDVPGVGKTVMASAVARSIDCSFSRIQLTPDLLPADVLGVTIYNRDASHFEFHRGPIFANVVLADEVNRTTPRTQTALLEAMSDGSVSVDGTVHILEQPFIVLATQNPYEFEGTYALPENQLDRFLMRIRLGYPTSEAETRLLDLRPAQTELPDLEPVLTGLEVLELQKQVDHVKLSEPIRSYIVELARRTRAHDQIDVGLSPRGSLALAHAARAQALTQDRDYVIPEDVLDNVQAVAAHRIIPRHADQGGWGRASDLLDEVVKATPSP